MSTFTVLGVDRETRKDRVVVVDAGSEDQAAESAMDQGLVEVKGVRAFDGPTRAPAPSSAWTPSRPRDLADQIERGVFAGMASLVLLITWVIIGASFIASTTGGVVLAAACLGTVMVVAWLGLDRLRR